MGNRLVVITQGYKMICVNVIRFMEYSELGSQYYVQIGPSENRWDSDLLGSLLIVLQCGPSPMVLAELYFVRPPVFSEPFVPTLPGCFLQTPH